MRNLHLNVNKKLKKLFHVIIYLQIIFIYKLFLLKNISFNFYIIFDKLKFSINNI